MINSRSSLDHLHMNMSPCTTQFMRGMDYLKEKPGAFASTRLVGPLALFPLLADGALHVTASALKIIYCAVTATAEITINAFNSKWKPVNPLGTQSWNRWEAGRHLVKACYCAGAVVLSVPLGLLAPSWEQKAVRKMHLARPEAPQQKKNDQPDSPLVAGGKKVVKSAVDLCSFPVDVVQGALARFPLLFNLTKYSLIAVGVGVGVHYAPEIVNRLGLDSLLHRFSGDGSAGGGA